MKKMIGLIIAGMMVMAAVGGATWATFNDTESSSANTMSTGTLDLQTATAVGGTYGNTNIATFTVSGLKPNDSAVQTGMVALKNAGSLTSSNLLVTSSAVTDTLTAGGSAIEASDLPGGNPTAAYISSVAMLALWIDVDHDGIWDTGDIGLKVTGTPGTYTFAESGTLIYDTFDHLAGKTWTTGTTMAAGAEKPFHASAYLPTSADNRAQGTQMSIDFSFEIDQ